MRLSPAATQDRVIKTPETEAARARLLKVRDACAKDRFEHFPKVVRQLSPEARDAGLVIFGTKGSSYLGQLRRIEEIVAVNPTLRIAAVVDDDAGDAGRVTAESGHVVLSVAEFFAQADKFRRSLVVDRTCTWYPGIQYKVKLAQNGLSVVRLEHFLNCPDIDVLGGHYRQHSDLMLSQFERFLALEDLWADSLSLSTYYCMLSGFISMSFQYFTFYCGDYESRYFPADVPFDFGQNEVFADCGSYDGYEARFFAEKVGRRFGAIHAFEPDASNYARLTANLDHYARQHGLNNIHCHPVGVYDRKAFLSYYGIGTGVALLDQPAEPGARGLNLVRLDDTLEKMTHLRLEVEGAELAALRGARGLITKYRPSMTISAYHKPSDFLDITDYIREDGSRYELRVRQQSLEAGVLCIHCT